MKEITKFNDVSELKVKKDESIKDNGKPVFGIDLGTTNSAISVIHEGVLSKTIALDNGKYTMPSCVMYHHGYFIVGDEAYRNRGNENVVYSVKRLMQDIGATVTVQEGREKITLTPAEVSANILRGLVDKTNGMYGKIEDVVVTVPAYFNQNGVNATKEACRLAGLNLIAIANEPTAASLCYDLKPNDNGIKDVIVYDLGGGTFDVTLARISEMDSDITEELSDIYGITDTAKNEASGKVINTLAIDGDAKLGGDDVDLAMLSILFEKLRSIGIDPDRFTDAYREKLLLRLEGLKKSDAQGMYNFNIKTIDKSGLDLETKIVLLPQDFMQAMDVVYKKTKVILDRLLSKNKTSADTIVLVGGSTKNPWLQSFLRRDFPDFRIDNALNPDLSVSNGASIFGKVAKFGSEGIHIFDILPITIGILDDGAVTPLVQNGTGLPTVSHKVFTTTYDNQRQLDVVVYQGNSVFPEECVVLGTLHIDGIPEMPAGKPNLVVSVSISTNRFMQCTAEINGIKKELKLDLSGEVSNTVKQLSRTEKNVLRWQKLANTFDGEDKKVFLKLIQDYKEADGSAASKKAVTEFVHNHTV